MWQLLDSDNFLMHITAKIINLDNINENELEVTKGKESF